MLAASAWIACWVDGASGPDCLDGDLATASTPGAPDATVHHEPIRVMPVLQRRVVILAGLVGRQYPRVVASQVHRYQLTPDQVEGLPSLTRWHPGPPGERGRCRGAERVHVAPAQLEPGRLQIDRRAFMFPHVQSTRGPPDRDPARSSRTCRACGSRGSRPTVNIPKSSAGSTYTAQRGLYVWIRRESCQADGSHASTRACMPTSASRGAVS